MNSHWKAALCLCLMLISAAAVPAQQKKDLSESERVRRLDVVPEPAPARHPKFYPGTSFRSLRMPEVDYGYVTANNRNYFYEKIGYGRENIVVVHGGPGLPHNYLLPALLSLTPFATVWFYDARGHGLSEQNYPTESYTMQQLVDDIGEFTRAANIQTYTLFGHSFGGMVALKYATQRPAGLRRLIVADTAPSIDYATQFQGRLKSVMPASQYAQYEAILRDETITADERLRRALRIVYPYYWYSAPPDDFLDQDINSMNLNALASDQIWASDGQTYDVRAQLAEVRVPTLVMRGQYDIVFSAEDARAIAEGIPNSRLVELPHSGHYPFYENSDMFSRWVYAFIHYHAV